MTSTATLPDIGSAVRIRTSACTLSGNRHPFAGRCGTVTGHRSGGTVQIELPGVDEDVMLGAELLEQLSDEPPWIDLAPDPMPGALPPATTTGAEEITYITTAGQADAIPAAGQRFHLVSQAGDAELRMLDLVDIARSATNPRTYFNPAKLQELAESIKAAGVHQPVLVRPLPAARLEDTFLDRTPGGTLPAFELVAGERRWRASKIAGRTTIPAIVRDLSDAQVLEIQLVENLQRDDLHPMEEAEGYERLMAATGATAEEVGLKIGRSRAYVYARINLLKLTTEVRVSFVAGLIDFSRALLISRVPDADLQRKALQVATEKDYQNETRRSYRDFERYVQQELMLPLDRARFKITQVDLVPNVGSCRECPKRTGANPDLFSDVKSADVCTDPKCYHAKEEAHDAAVLATAKASGKQVISGKAAKEAWPSSFREDLEGYVRLDKPDARTQSKKAVKTLLGKDAPEAMVLVSPHDGTMVEVLPRETVTRILKNKGHLTPAMARLKRQPSEHEVKRKLEEEYESAWRTRAINAVWKEMCHDTSDGLSAAVVGLLARRLVSDLRQDERGHVARLLGLGKVATHEGIRDYLDTPEVRDTHRIEHVTMLLLMQADMVNMTDYNGASKSAPHIEAIAADFDVNLAAIQQSAKEELAEAAKNVKVPAEKPAATTPAKGKGAAKPAAKRATKEEAAAGIAAALQAAEQAPGPNDFKVGDAVRFKADLRSAAGKMRKVSGRSGLIKASTGDRAWLVKFGSKAHEEAIADYTEIEHAADQAQPDATPTTQKPSASRPAPKYRCKMTGATWSGRGLKPAWVRAALEDGKTLQELEYIEGEENAEESAQGDVEDDEDLAAEGGGA